MPRRLSELQCSQAFHWAQLNVAYKFPRRQSVVRCEIDVAARFNKLLGNNENPSNSREMNGCESTFVLVINVTARCNEQFDDWRMAMHGRVDERRIPLLVLELKIRVRINELLRDGDMTISKMRFSMGRDVEGRLPCLVLNLICPIKI